MDENFLHGLSSDIDVQEGFEKSAKGEIRGRYTKVD